MLDQKKDPAALAQLLSAAYTELVQSGLVSSVSPDFPSHLELSREAARDFLVSTEQHGPYDPEPGGLRPSWKMLIAVLFHQYFHRMQRYGPRMTSDPLVDALLLRCDSADWQSLSRKPDFSRLFSLIVCCIEDGLPSRALTSESAIPDFFQELETQWLFYKDMRLEVLTESLMPWSTISIQEGSLDGKLPLIILRMKVTHR